MKKLMFSTAAILALSLSAFAGTPEKAEAKTATETNAQTSDVLHWFDMSSTPAYLQSNTIEDEESPGCEPNKQGCERAYRDDQFNTFGVPTSGVKPGQINSPIATLGFQ
ncbi:MAG: hypothetical protein JNM21_14835 [Taibaiella sp.]|nr:hypothetical protein [Taibaiella sp.]